MRFYNTLTKKKEEFVPLEEGKVRMYVCGPTVYNLIHIGNARPMIVFDTLRRYMEYKGYEVNYVSNFTDVDDKIIAAANEEGVTSEEISKRYIEECKKDMEALNVRPATVHPKATEEIGGMIEMIQDLIDKGHAYEANGTVYYRTRTFKDYGKLSHKNLDDLRSGNREIKVTGEENKEDPLDFVLWKPKKEGEPSWPSPWSDGRPGWHIECSEMSRKYLGTQIDIHGGGEDLIFPHHENEIAQSEGCSGVEFARYWLHNAFLKVDNEKMSKSLGNFFTVRDICEKYDPQVLRFFMLTGHYRTPLNYSPDIMEASKNSLERIVNAGESLKAFAEAADRRERSQTVAEESVILSGAEGSRPESPHVILSGADRSRPESPHVILSERSESKDPIRESDLLEDMKKFRTSFEEAMDDDMNTADAIAAVFELVKFANINVTAESSKEFAQKVKDELDLLCGILGIRTERKAEVLDEEIEELIAQRQAARKAKDFAKADAIRAQLLEAGIILEDTREGVKWKRA